jgi:hypothetical protein
MSQGTLITRSLVCKDRLTNQLAITVFSHLVSISDRGPVAKDDPYVSIHGTTIAFE